MDGFPQHEAMTIGEAADFLRISKSHAYEAAARGQIPAFRIGTRWIVPRAKLMKLLEEGGLTETAPEAA